LRDRRKRAGQERRSGAGGGEAFDETTPVDRELLFVHAGPSYVSRSRACSSSQNRTASAVTFKSIKRTLSAWARYVPSGRSARR
jgi:hypothetical protein